MPKYIPDFQEQYTKNYLLGRGCAAAGGVYEYIKQNSQQSYAVKIYTEKLQNSDFQYIINEIQILNKIDNCLKSQNVVKFYGFGMEIIKNYVEIFIVLDKADGTLQDLWQDHLNRKQYLEFNQIIDITQQLIITFSELEGRGLAHRDLKMENILYNISQDGKIQVKISDFSESKLYINNEKTLNTFAGNIYHVSPEVFYSLKRGEIMDIKYSTFQNDVYGLGVLLIDLCLLSRKQNRDKEAEVNPFNVLEGPYDLEWQQRLEDLKQIYSKKEPLQIQKIINVCEFYQKMITFSPIKRPRFHQLLYQWMDIEPIRIISLKDSYFTQENQEDNKKIDTINNQKKQKNLQNQNIQQNQIKENLNQNDFYEFKTTIPYKQNLQELELKKKISNGSCNNSVSLVNTDTEKNKYFLINSITKLTDDQNDVTIIATKHNVVPKLNKESKKVLFKSMDENIIQAISKIINPKYIILNMQGSKYNCCNSIQTICDAIKAMPQVQSLQINIGCWDFTIDEEVEQLCESLKTLQNIQCLSLKLWEWGYKNKYITDKSLIYIGSSLKFLKNKLIYLKLGLQRWGCENELITDFGYQKLFQDLQELNLISFSGTFGSISKNNDNITDLTLLYFQNFLQSQKNLLHLKVVLSRLDNNNINISQNQILEFLDFLEEKKSIEKLCIIMNGMQKLSSNVKKKYIQKLEQLNIQLKLELN